MVGVDYRSHEVVVAIHPQGRLFYVRQQSGEGLAFFLSTVDDRTASCAAIGSGEQGGSTDAPPPEVAAAGHDRCVVAIKPEHLDLWLNPDPGKLDEQRAVLDDRERPL